MASARSLALATALALSFSAPAAATIVEVTVTGTLAGGIDQTGVLGQGTNKDLTGLGVTIVFTIDAARAPADLLPSTTASNFDSELYGSPNPAANFIASTWTIQGVSRTSFQPTRDQIDQVVLSDGNQPGDYDSFAIRDGAYDGTATTNDRYYYVALLAILSDVDMLDGDALVQAPGSLTAIASPLSCGQCYGGWQDFTNGKNEAIDFSIAPTGLSIAYRIVPEPAVAGLLGVACLVGAVRARRR